MKNYEKINRLKTINLIVKYVYQIFLYLLETLGISILCTMIVNKIAPIDNIFDFLERVTFFYALYQIIIYNVLQQINDVKRDECLALSTMYKLTKLYIETKSTTIKNDILSKLQYQLKPSTFNDNKIRTEYLNIKNIVENPQKQYIDIINYKLIYCEQWMEEAVLNWKYSIILRLLK